MASCHFEPAEFVCRIVEVAVGEGIGTESCRSEISSPGLNEILAVFLLQRRKERGGIGLGFTAVSPKPNLPHLGIGLD